MADARKVTEGLLHMLELASGGIKLVDDVELEFGKITQSLPPTAAAFSQRTMPVTVDGEQFVVVAYKVAK